MSLGYSLSRFPGMQNERGTQHGTSRRTPLPLFRAVSIFCLSVAILDLATCGVRPQPAALREGYQTGRGPPTSGASGYPSGGLEKMASPQRFEDEKPPTL